MTKKINNAFCSICGKGYYLCQSCKEQLSLSPWKIHTDTSEHFKIFQVIRGYSIGLYTKEEAKDKFKNLDLTDVKDFLPKIQSVIETILADETPFNETENIQDTTNTEKKIRKSKHGGDLHKKFRETI